VTETITDSLGRTLQVQKPTGRELMKLMRVCGAAWSIPDYQTNVLVATCIKSIDNVPVPKPESVEQMDGMPDRIGPEGMAAVVDWMASLSPPDPAQVVADAKN
jgi:hypothetical protein